NSRSQLLIDLKAIGAVASSGAGSFVQEIKQANERLLTMGKTMFTKKITTPEEDALKTRFGLSTNQVKDAGILGLKSNKRRSQRQTVKEGFTSMFSDGKKETPNIEVPQLDQIADGEEKVFKTTMVSSVNDILQEASQQKDYVMMAENADVLTRFGLLSQQITTLNGIIGEKSKDNSLIKNLGEVCTNQCSNITSKKCYY
ncbi:MAG: hypothetical protein WCO66_02745, partial [Candidatus Absconditabacteria bacterium]